MNTGKTSLICKVGIKITFILLFILIPIVFTSINSELFEFNKMILTYLLTIIILFLWITRMIIEKRIIFKRSFLEMPLFIFYLSQALSTLFSHDLYMSLFGYYSRFNQGLLSLTAYLILYFAFVSNIKISVHPSEIPASPAGKRINQNGYINKLIIAILLSSLIVATYGILQHFGIDYYHWVQDVKTRVFSTLGQPNWLGAYLAIILMIAFGVYFSILENLSTVANNLKFKSQNIKSQFKIQNQDNNLTIQQPARNAFCIANAGGFNNGNFLNFLKIYILPLIIIAIFYTCLLFTRSRSAFTAFHICFGIFTILSIGVSAVEPLRSIIKKIFFTMYLLFFLLINIFNIFPTPIEKLNGLTIPNLINKISSTINTKPQEQKKGASPSQFSSENGEGGTESFAIRKIVWQGAWNTFLAHPIVGYGTETFALAYYRYKPLEQNLVSEWDFLYNKAHNEYLNYLATSGIIGFGSYIFLIIIFTIYCLREIIKRKNIIVLSLFLAWATILITNLLGFSVVIISLYFYLIPAIIIIINQTPQQNNDEDLTKKQENNQQCNNLPANATHQALQAGVTMKQWLSIYILLFTTYYVLRTTYSWWLADTHYKKALETSSYEEFQKAIKLSPFHPAYHNELAMTLSELPTTLTEKTDKKILLNIAEESIKENDIAISISPDNPLFWNYRALIFHNLNFLNKEYAKEAIIAILKAKNLAPNDPKITYFAGIYYLNNNQNNMTLKYFEETVKLKPNYIEPTINLAKFYSDQKQPEKAEKLLQNLLKYYNNNENIKKLIKEYQK
jgi:putative inorganic carbon (hco3(-)) transporter